MKKSSKSKQRPKKPVISDREIRRKYESGIQKLKKRGQSGFGIITAALYKKYGKRRVQAALEPIRKKATKKAAATRKSKKKLPRKTAARSRKRRNPGETWPLLMMFGPIVSRSGKKFLEAAEKYPVDSFEFSVDPRSTEGKLTVWFGSWHPFADNDIHKYAMKTNEEAGSATFFIPGIDKPFKMQLPSNLVCEQMHMQMILPGLNAQGVVITNDSVEVHVAWEDRVARLKTLLGSFSEQGGVQTYGCPLIRVD